MDPLSWERIGSPMPFGSLDLLARGLAPLRPAFNGAHAVESYLGALGRPPFRQLVLVRRYPELRAGDAMERFSDRARVLLRLKHNNLMPVLDAGQVQHQPYIAFAALGGRSLAQLRGQLGGQLGGQPRDKGQGLSVPLAVYVMRDLLRALHCAHSFPGLPVFHRDLGPDRVFLEWNGAVRLSDFLVSEAPDKLAGTLPGVTPEAAKYLSPEQTRGASLDARSDLFSCSVMLWELLTGCCMREALEGKVHADALAKLPAPSQVAQGVDPELDAVVMRGLQVDRAQRWPDAHAMMLRLSSWLSAHASQAGQEVLAAHLCKQFPGAASKEHLAAESLLRFADAASGSIRPEMAPSSPNLPASHSPKIRDTALGRAVVAPGTQRGISISTPVTIRRDLNGASHAVRPLVSPPEKLQANAVVAQRYRIERRLGKGGMGTVYRAKHLQVGRAVALKVLARAWSHNEDVARRFRAEARAASAAGHPNIVEVFDAGELSDGRLFFVMEYLEGQNLYKILRSEGPMSLSRAIDIMVQVARAVKAAHDVNVIHRDLKPDNVMLVDRGSGESSAVKVLDFGISAMIDERNETRWTKPGHAVGTPEYMAPEQARGVEATRLFDVYAWGAMFFEMLCGQAPLTGTDFVDVMAKKNDVAAPALKSVRGDAPDELCELVDACLRIDPAQRPQSMGEVLVALEDCGLQLRRQENKLPVNKLHEDQDHSATRKQDPVASKPEPPEGSGSSRTWAISLGIAGAAVMAGLWFQSRVFQPNSGRDASLAVTPMLVPSETSSGDERSPTLPPAALAKVPRAASLAPVRASGLVAPLVASERAPNQRRESPASAQPDKVESVAPVVTERPAYCESLETRIRRARRRGKTALMLGLLRSGSDRQCWRGKIHRKQWARWRVHALKEEKQWVECQRAAQPFASDPQVRQDLVLCRAREQMHLREHL